MYILTRKLNERESTYQAKLRTLEVYKHNWHNVSKVCKLAHISRDTFYEWQREDSEFRSILIDIEKSECDEVEDKLRDLIEEHNTTAIIFFLKHRHPSYS